MRRFILLSLLLSLTALEACGTRGPLTLPPQDKTALIAPQAERSVVAMALNRTDLNTTQEPAL